MISDFGKQQALKDLHKCLMPSEDSCHFYVDNELAGEFVNTHIFILYELLSTDKGE